MCSYLYPPHPAPHSQTQPHPTVPHPAAPNPTPSRPNPSHTDSTHLTPNHTIQHHQPPRSLRSILADGHRVLAQGKGCPRLQAIPQRSGQPGGVAKEAGVPSFTGRAAQRRRQTRVNGRTLCCCGWLTPRQGLLHLLGSCFFLRSDGLGSTKMSNHRLYM